MHSHHELLNALHNVAKAGQSILQRLQSGNQVQQELSTHQQAKQVFPSPAQGHIGSPPHNKGHTATKEALGRSTWSLLHILAAQFPERPSRGQQKDVRTLVLSPS